MQHVIIGNGIAGVCAAEAIRQSGSTDPIVMIGDEPVTPYGRPLISQVLEGSLRPDQLAIRSPDFYQRLGIQTVFGHRATSVDPAARTVGLAGGAAIGYDRLLVATGADPRPLLAEGTDLANIFFLRTAAQARQQVEALGQAHRALVLGGGLVGFKAAYGLLRRGLAVTMLITSDYPLAMQVDPTAGRMILDEMLAHGLKVEVGASVAGFAGNGKVRAAVTAAGTTIDCDLVIIGKGVAPAHGLVPRDKIAIDAGILVDEHLQTGVAGIFAAGDVAESVDISRQGRWVNAIWPEASAQGRVAGLNMAGRPVAYPGSLSRNVMRIFSLDLMTLGNPNPVSCPGVTIVQSGGPGRGFYRRLVVRDGLLVGAVLINRIEQGGVLRALIANRVPLGLPAEELIAAGFNFGRLLR